MTTIDPLERVSVEPSRRCSKGCSFCYNGSAPAADEGWSAAELVAFGRDLAAHGVRVLSIGGGEPLEWPGIFDALDGLAGALERSITTHGLRLSDPTTFARLVACRPDKVHVSIHNPGHRGEVARVIAQVLALLQRGVCSGINLVVAASRVAEATRAASMVRAAGLGNERIVYLPMRGSDTPTPREVARVAAGPFQSMTCLPACGRSPRFASVAADRTAAWCSYTRTRRRLRSLTHAALLDALDGLGLRPCSGGELVRVDAPPR